MLRPYKGVTRRVDPGAHVDPGAQVIGAAGLGTEASVWTNAVVRGDAEVASILASSERYVNYRLDYMTA